MGSSAVLTILFNKHAALRLLIELGKAPRYSFAYTHNWQLRRAVHAAVQQGHSQALVFVQHCKSSTPISELLP